MIQLKQYQQRALDSLRSFLRQCAKDGHPQVAFEIVQRTNGSYPLPYVSVPAAGILPDMPYVCLRVPTGGGKTLLACYASGLAKDEFLHAERAVVLWLVPSNTILEQTVKALRDPRHPYRRALELSCRTVEVLTIDEALHLSRAVVDGQTVVVVATIQSFRVEDTTGRKVYEENGLLLEHFLNLPFSQAAQLLFGPDSKPVPSLANVLRLRHPIIIVDEAHNARTDLSFSTLGGLLPSCIIEFTATPATMNNPSNVLHRVSAAELKNEHMIKLPLRVETRHPSQRDQLLSEAVWMLLGLQKIAEREGQETGEYLRPIMLIQAERVDACEPLRERLASVFHIPREQVKISTGKLDELKDIPDINSLKCPVTFIITVEKLREGWDCPFAYVLCSLRETHSATAIEQIVGRIIRLPAVTEKRHPELNCAYAFSVSESLPEVLSELRDALVSNGFTSAEAERIILSPTQGTLPLGTHERVIHFEAGKEIDPEVAQLQAPALVGKVRLDPEKGNIVILTSLDKTDTERVMSCVRSLEAKTQLAEAITQVAALEKAFGRTGLTRVPSPYEKQLDFLVPLLSVLDEGKLLDFESTFLLEHPWKLSSKDASLPDSYNPLVRPAAKTGVVDISAKGNVETTVWRDGYDATPYQVPFQISSSTWTVEGLVVWLDNHINHQDISSSESAVFILRTIQGLMVKFGIADVGALGLDCFRLRDEIEARIQEHRVTERKAAFQKYMELGSPLIVSEERSINFKGIIYDPASYYGGSFQFKKHYFPQGPGELPEKTPGGALTEEFQCAQFIDELPEVEFWVRNLPRRTSSFRLQTSKDWFYPDFICQLKDGRLMTIEYKGSHLYDASDAKEKSVVGAVWASRSKGKCLFVMPMGKDFGVIIKAVREA